MYDVVDNDAIDMFAIFYMPAWHPFLRCGDSARPRSKGGCTNMYVA